MKKYPIYRVVKHTYYERCDKKNEQYTIQVKKKFLFFWEKWFTIKERICGMGECISTPIKFHTESEAIFAIKNLEQGMIADGWVGEVSTVIDFNKKYQEQ